MKRTLAALIASAAIAAPVYAQTPTLAQARQGINAIRSKLDSVAIATQNQTGIYNPSAEGMAGTVDGKLTRYIMITNKDALKSYAKYMGIADLAQFDTMPQNVHALAVLGTYKGSDFRALDIRMDGSVEYGRIEKGPALQWSQNAQKMLFNEGYRNAVVKKSTTPYRRIG